MTDSTLVIVVTSISGIITSLSGIVMMIVKSRLDRAERTMQQTSATINQQAGHIAQIEKQGNSIQTEMVRLTKEASLAKGEQIGVAKEKAEQAAKALVKADLRETADQSHAEPRAPVVVPVEIVSMPKDDPGDS